MKQNIRIIGGKWRGKKLSFPEIDGLRPTPNRIRETLFNWLMHPIKGARCLDAFAGSGALGLEAFSRGAHSVHFIEQNPLAHAHLKKAISEFQTPDLHLLKTDACTYLAQAKEVFDIVFLDPPFAKNLLTPCLELLVSKPVLNDGGLVYLESANPFDLDMDTWTVLQSKQAGSVFYGLIQKCLPS